MTPYVNLPDTAIKVEKTTRGVWRITSTCRVRSGPDNGYKIVGTYQKPGVAVSRLYSAISPSAVTAAVERIHWVRHGPTSR